MIDKKRDLALQEWRKISKKINELSNLNCKGINTEFLAFGARAIRKILRDLNDEDGIHINEVASHFGVTTVCIRKWLAKDGLPNPIMKKDEERTFIPFYVFEELQKRH